MLIPVIRGVIDRRILINYRVDPDVLAKTLPAPFRPQLIHGVGMAGICLIRLKSLRPKALPAWLGLSSENAAHRTAVCWENDGTTRNGVYVRRRDTSLWLNAMAGGRLFPGVHYHARFVAEESAERFAVAVRSNDGAVNISIRARLAEQLPASSIFTSTAEASGFFAAGSLGYSDAPAASRFQGLELRCLNWHAEPLEVEEVHSTYFENAAIFPKGSIEFYGALIMRAIVHEWHGQSDLCCSTNVS